MFRHVYAKEMLDSFRDKKTILLSVIIPIIFSIGIVFFMDNILLSESPQDPIDVAVNDTADQAVIEWLGEVDSVNLHLSSTPIEDAKEGEVLVALEVEETFMEQVAQSDVPMIHVHADPTSSKADAVVSDVMNVFGEKQSEIVAANLATENVGMEKLQSFDVDVQALSGDDALSMYMISIIAQIVIVIAVLMGGLPASSDLFAGEKERKTMEALMMTPVNRLHILIGKWLTIATLGIMSGIFSVITLVVFVQLFTTNMKEALDLSSNVTYFLTSLSAGIVMFALLVASLQMILSLLANTMKEAQNYVSPIMMIAMIPYFLLIDVSPHELTNTYFVIPFMNIYALIKQLIYGVYDLTSILLVVGSSAVFIAITLGIGMIMFSKSKWVLGKS